MKPILYGSKTYTLMKRTLTETSDSHGEASESYADIGTVRVKMYPSGKTQTNAPEGVNVNDLYTGVTDCTTVDMRDYLVDGTNAFLVTGIKAYQGSVQMDLWKDGRYYG